MKDVLNYISAMGMVACSVLVIGSSMYVLFFFLVYSPTKWKDDDMFRRFNNRRTSRTFFTTLKIIACFWIVFFFVYTFTS